MLEDAKNFPSLAGIRRKIEGGRDTVMYLEGSDQHRGWFQSSLLESCGTRGRAPYDIVVTHGFTLDEQGRKMSKSLKNGVEPQDVIKQSGADILRLWVCATDYWDDQRIGPEILKNTVETYRKLRNTLRWMLGSLAHFRPGDTVAREKMPELERLMLHRLAELDGIVRAAYAEFDYKRIVASLTAFMNTDLSAFYVDVRKDVLYCDPISSVTRKASLTMIDMLCDALLEVARADPALHLRGGLARLSPAGRALGASPRLSRRGSADGATTRSPRNGARCAPCAAWSPARSRSSGPQSASAPRSKRRRSSMSPIPTCSPRWSSVDLAEISITSHATLVAGEGPADAFRLDDVPGVAVEVHRAEGRKCARSWKILPSVGDDPDYPDVSPRDAQALREWDAWRKAQA